MDLPIQGEFRLIPKDQLIIDVDHYQREAVGGSSKIKAFAQGWSWALCGTLSVSERGNGKGLFVFDGGHRLRGALEVEAISLMPCMVYQASSVEEEAYWFTLANKYAKGNVGVFDLYRADLCARNKEALLCDQIVTQNGYRVSKDKSKRTFIGIGTLRQLVHQTPELAEAAFACAATIAHGEMFSGRVLKSLFALGRHFLAKEPPVTVLLPDIIKPLVRLGVKKLEEEIDRIISLTDNSSPDNISQWLLPIINKGRSEKMSW